MGALTLRVLALDARARLPYACSIVVNVDDIGGIVVLAAVPAVPISVTVPAIPISVMLPSRTPVAHAHGAPSPIAVVIEP